MQLITHQNHIDRLPTSPVKTHIQARFDQLTENPNEIPLVFILVEEEDDITCSYYSFIGNCDLLSDLFEVDYEAD